MRQLRMDNGEVRDAYTCQTDGCETLVPPGVDTCDEHTEDDA